MGNVVSQNVLNGIDPSHVRIYINLIQIRDTSKRIQMIQTLLAAPEYIHSAKRAGIYSYLLGFVASVQRGVAPPPLPGEGGETLQVQRVPQLQYQGNSNASAQLVAHAPQQRPAYQQVIKSKNKDKAINYFQNCLEVLGLEEEVAMNEDGLKKAYRVAAGRAHPDKGGTEEQFEAVTRAYAYLSEILRRIHGGRTKEGKVEAPSQLSDARTQESDQWKHVEPIRLNPKKLDLNAFNQMYEKTRMPDPDDDGYGDWLQEKTDSKQGPAFSGKFNRDVFNQMFEDRNRKDPESGALISLQPQAMTLAPMAVELGRDRPNSYTAPANANLKYTDLKQAYTIENTVSNQVANVRIDIRDIKSYQADRKRAPDPMSDREMAAIASAEKAAAERERQRSLRAAQEGAVASEHFSRMQRLVLTDKGKKEK
jgi:curved DNA-binding protein CbpA